MIQPEKKFTIALTVSGVIVMALLFLIILPLLGSIQQHSATLYQDRIKAEIAASQRRSATSSRVEYDQLKSKSDGLQQFFVSEMNVLEFISSLEGAAGKAGVGQTIDNLRAPEKGTTEATIQITASGSFPSIITYLNNIEQLPYYVTITHVTFTSDTTNAVHAALQAQIYWL